MSSGAFPGCLNYGVVRSPVFHSTFFCVPDVVEGRVHPVYQQALQSQGASEIDVWGGQSEAVHRGMELGVEVEGSSATFSHHFAPAIMLDAVPFVKATTEPAGHDLLLVTSGGCPAVPHGAEDGRRNTGRHQRDESGEQPLGSVRVPARRVLPDDAWDERVSSRIVELPSFQFFLETFPWVL